VGSSIEAYTDGFIQCVVVVVFNLVFLVC